MQLWKVHPEGGEAIRVTSNGGSRGWESTRGTYVYYQRSSNVRGLCMLVYGGDEELVLEKVPAGSWPGWAVTDEGIYFVEPINNNHVIEFYSLATRRLTQIATAT